MFEMCVGSAYNCKSEARGENFKEAFKDQPSLSASLLENERNVKYVATKIQSISYETKPYAIPSLEN